MFVSCVPRAANDDVIQFVFVSHVCYDSESHDCSVCHWHPSLSAGLRVGVCVSLCIVLVCVIMMCPRVVVFSYVYEHVLYVC